MFALFEHDFTRNLNFLYETTLGPQIKKKITLLIFFSSPFFAMWQEIIFKDKNIFSFLIIMLR